VQGRSQKFVSEGDKTGGMHGDRSPTARSRGMVWVCLGAKPPEAEDVYVNKNSNNVLTMQNPLKFFSAWEFPGGRGICFPFHTPLECLDW